MILKLLKERTAALHERIEKTLDLPARLKSTEAYRHLLARFYGVYFPLESQLVEVPGYERIGLDASTRRKVPLLIKDLRALNQTREGIERIPLSPDVPNVQNLAQALGCLYVTEGATLGGQIIRKEVQRQLGFTSEDGGSFFAGYGEQTGNRWRDFCSSCTAYFERFPDAADETIAAASQTFLCLETWIAV